MNITQTFRRKNKFHRPILVFKQLYRDYFKHHSKQQSLPPCIDQNATVKQKFNNKSHKSFSKTLIDIQSNGVPKIKKTKSTELFTNYLNKFADPGTTYLNYSRNTHSRLRKSKASDKNTYVFRLLERSELEQIQRDKQSYFKNGYTKSHPFFQKAEGLFKQKQLNQRQKQIPKILPQIFRQTSNRLSNPMQKRKQIQLQTLKTKLNQRKNISTQKFQKIRYNFLIKKNFKYQKQNISQINKNNQQQKNLLSTLRQKNSLQRTKSNIFPQNFS